MAARRQQGWRDKYARRLGLRPSERDEETSEVVEAECRFCAVFGREPRAENNALAGQRRQRKRTANVAKWTRPFRPDNIRSHHVAQHTRRWGAYSELLRQLNYPEEGEDARAAKQQLDTFFDRSETSEMATASSEAADNGRRGVQVAAADVAATASVAAAAAGPEIDEAPVEAVDGAVHEANGTRDDAAPRQLMQVAARADPLLLLGEITTPEIVDTLVDGFYVEDDDNVRADAKDADLMKRIRVDDRVAGGQQGQASSDRRTEKFVVRVTNKQELVSVQRLLGLGLTIEQVARTLACSTLSVATVRSYARLSIAASLQMISTIMRRAWIYSLAFQVTRGRGNRNPVLQLRVRLPVSRGTDVADLHVVALPLLKFERSAGQVTTFIELVLNVLDPEWRSKMLGGCVNGAANEMGMHSSLLQDIMQQSTSSCVYCIRRPAQVIESCLRSALQDLSEGRYQQSTTSTSDILEKGRFSQELARLSIFLRGYEPWTRVHGRCPPFDPECPWSTLKTLEWLLTRRHHIQDKFQDYPYVQLPPPSFWLFASVLVDVMSGFEDVVNNLESFPLPSRTKSEHNLEFCVSDFAQKSRISRTKDDETVLENDMCLERGTFQVGHFCWTRKSALVPYLRSLNLSMRRLYDGLPSGDKHNVEWVVAGFVLTCLDSVAKISEPNLLEASRPSNSTLGSKTVMDDPPPALPLDFIAIKRMDAVDLIECYSDRLEQAYDLAFLDNISCDMEKLKTMITDHPSLRSELKHAQSNSFRSAWECIPDLGSLRVFATGLATTLPRTVGRHSDLQSIGPNNGKIALALEERNEDQHRVNFGDFTTEMRLHAEQASIVQALYSERMHH
ncbi:hypothetical protein PHYPSEUDO_007914 [Phytophthora pseudosyringae]|uniref:Uncharacterized protein n=1 Tax=Phytophthora pseudosyringae TaxID=221518 RepID=A0A8T1WAW6_9STRA|nr:hypothetical protein PHYPSEUDO_007914 [Phytophthora pseudosyringae]